MSRPARGPGPGLALLATAVLGLSVGGPALAEGAGTGSLRVYAIEGATFDYVFKGVSGELEGKPVLALNHRSGQTFFVQVGDPVGSYRVRDFIQATNQVFRPSLNAYLPQVTGRLILERGQESLVLEQDRRLTQPGWAAGLIRLDTAEKWQVKEGDVIEVGGVWIRVKVITDTAVTIAELGGGERTLSAISPEERAQVSETIRLRRAEAEKRQAESRARAAAEAARAAEAEKAAWAADETAYLRRRALGAATPTVMFVGEEYRVPMDCRFLPAVVAPSGRVIRPVTVLPMRFETRFNGVLIRTP